MVCGDYILLVVLIKAEYFEYFQSCLKSWNIFLIMLRLLCTNENETCFFFNNCNVYSEEKNNLTL